MTADSRVRELVRLVLVAAISFGGPASASAEESWPKLFGPAKVALQTQNPVAGHTDQGSQQTEYPALHVSGFGDVNFAAQKASEGARGFSLGQFTLHLASALSPRVNVFGELSFTARADAGTGSPAAAGFNAEVERLIIRFDHSDELKVSFGRYHTPINWWNTAFHHGQWLQTTISRPEMVQFGGRFIPVHFVGALAEGVFPSRGWNVNYQAGVGNGRGAVISRGGDATDNNARPAWLVNFFTRPDRWFGLQAGGGWYLDRVTQTGRPEFDERIVAGHLVWQREDPELIAEIAHIRHTEAGTGTDTSNLAYYVQAAYRLPGIADLWKPYYRFEHIEVDSADQVFSGVPDLDGSTLGVRFDITTYAALKTEGRWRKRTSDQPSNNGWFFQVSFTF